MLKTIKSIFKRKDTVEHHNKEADTMPTKSKTAKPAAKKVTAKPVAKKVVAKPAAKKAPAKPVTKPAAKAAAKKAKQK